MYNLMVRYEKRKLMMKGCRLWKLVVLGRFESV